MLDKERLGLTNDEERPDASGVREVKYSVHIYDEDRRTIDSFTEEEKEWLRPIAETIAMIDGNAFFGNEITDGREWYEQYLPEAWGLFTNNGGIDGWAGEVSWIKGNGTDNPSVKAAWEEYLLMKKLAQQGK